ncbi:MAG: tetratricopeptide repeat protein [Myxococcales bacterium]|nr:tetratricopeptide repeat protein [Myxococcales bacterium]
MILVRSGNLTSEPLPLLLQSLYREHLTGVLLLEAAGGTKQIYFRSGYPVGVSASGAIDQLGRVLLDTAMITQEAFNQWSAVTLDDGTRIGQLLISAGVISDEQLREALKVQIRRRLFRLFYVERGVFTIQSGDHPVGVEGNEDLRIQPRRVIYQGIRNTWTSQRVKTAVAQLQGQALQLAVEPAVLARYGFSDGDALIAAVLAGQPARLEALAHTTNQPADAVNAVVCALYFTDALNLTPGNVPRSRSITPPTGEVALPPPTQRAQARPSATTREPQRPAPPRAASPPEAAPAPPAASRVPRSPPPQAAEPTKPSSGTYPAVPPTQEMEELRQMIGGKLRTLEKDDLFTVLGLKPDARKDQVKNAYLSLAKVFHPDRFSASRFAPMRADVGKIFRRLNEAYATLFDDERRSAYVKKKDAPESSPAEEARARAVLDGEMAFLQGEVAFKKRDFAAAVMAFARSVDLNPEEGEHLAMLAWSRLSAKQATLADIKRDLRNAIAKSPRCARAHYYLGVVLRDEGDPEHAIGELRKALEIDPRLSDAASEIRLINTRKEKQGGKSLLDRFRKKT